MASMVRTMSEEFPSRTLDKIVIRAPDGLRDRLKDAASASGRSMNAEIVARLETSFATRIGDERAEEVIAVVRGLVTAQHLADLLDEDTAEEFEEYCVMSGLDYSDWTLSHLIKTSLERLKAEKPTGVRGGSYPEGDLDDVD